MATEIPGWERSEYSDDGICHTVFAKGTGPGVILMHELPGLTRQCVDLGECLVSEGYRAFMPLLFGQPNERASLRNSVRICISREIWLFSSRQTSPIVDWLRALCRKVKDECGG